ncbi:hypothetical protein INP83_05050 [Mucilaginibacter sp. 21P]|uniref:hypothetical protein n=1 Tax=Mucilaginibacter sp. 21P TaxID=2778902 RepID=UPI001C597301|nr:hypothetical protein [Mucilaginibacter sp. 21P]QXV66454.1 hypothetical protein INP83_05050 [Mucilaginibacter sp. 21P]
MQLNEVSISSQEKTEPFYSLATTDFESYGIPAPEKGFRGGTNDDVLLYFDNAEQMEKYIEQLHALRNLQNALEPKTVKLKKIIDSIGYALPLIRLKEVFLVKKFREVDSNISYVFKNDTLIISDTPYSQYRIIELEHKFFLESQLDNAPLLITEENGVYLLTDANNRIRASLREE